MSRVAALGPRSVVIVDDNGLYVVTSFVEVAGKRWDNARIVHVGDSPEAKLLAEYLGRRTLIRH